MKLKPAVLIAPGLVVLVLVLGLRQEQRRPTQRFDRYTAVRALDIWRFFGREVYASNRLSVCLDGDEDRPDRHQALRIESGWFGERHSDQGGQFGLGEDDYDREGCIGYLLSSLLKSEDPADRIVAINSLWRPEKYPGQREEVEALVDDPEPQVRAAARSRLARVQKSD